MANPETANWYVIHTYSGYEALVKDTIEKLIENNNLADTILDIKIPTEETIEEKANGKKKIVQRKILPCYVFVKMVYSNDMWYLLTNTRGVTGFVGPQGKAVPLPEEEIKKMRLEDKVEHFDFAEGDSVRIVSRSYRVARRCKPESESQGFDVRQRNGSRTRLCSTRQTRSYRHVIIYYND